MPCIDGLCATSLSSASSTLPLTQSQSQRFSGGFTERATPVPIPNTAVKPLRADDTARATAWESRTPPDPFSSMQNALLPGGRFAFLPPHRSRSYVTRLSLVAVRRSPPQARAVFAASGDLTGGIVRPESLSESTAGLFAGCGGVLGAGKWLLSVRGHSRAGMQGALRARRRSRRDTLRWRKSLLRAVGDAVSATELEYHP